MNVLSSMEHKSVGESVIDFSGSQVVCFARRLTWMPVREWSPQRKYPKAYAHRSSSQDLNSGTLYLWLLLRWSPPCKMGLQAVSRSFSAVNTSGYRYNTQDTFNSFSYTHAVHCKGVVCNNRPICCPRDHKPCTMYSSMC